MTFHILAVFPEVLKPYLEESILGKAIKKNLIQVKFYDLRDFTEDKHRKVDDKAYGGGPGMVIGVEPLTRALEQILKGKPKDKTEVLITSPAGKQFDSKKAVALSKKYKHLVIVVGRYEGVDERILRVIKSGLGFGVEEVSAGPYVLTGGELPAMAVVDAVARHIKGVVGKEFSIEEKRYGVGVPSYTRPEIFRYKGRQYRVPRELISGDHKAIENWRKKNRKQK